MANWFNRLIEKRQKKRQINDLHAIESLPFELLKNSEILSEDRLHVIHDFRKSVQTQLRILQTALGATSVVLFWSGPGQEEMTVFSFSSQNKNFKDSSYSISSGVFGILKECNDISIAPYQPSSPAIPYCQHENQVGSFYAQTVPCGTTMQHDMGEYGVLCLDRLSAEGWSATEKGLISATADQIFRNLTLSRDLLFTDIERNTLQLVFNGLKALNTALNLESVYIAATQALGLIVSADVFAISLVHADHHELCYLSDHGSEKKLNQQFPLEDSLIGQVVKYRRALPEKLSDIGRAPIINGSKLFDRYKSVLVVPLMQENRPVTGVLIIAACGENQVTRNSRELIEMIAAQVAIKIDLAQSHEQIQQMAITDPLTGIANRRAFQCAFTSMYERARRRSGSFSLIICDIDLFKQVNDIYGHPFGDRVIQQVAKQLNGVVRTGDLAARIGGEEFAILLEDTGASGALDVAERLRKKVQKLRLLSQGETVTVTISAGLAAFPQDTDNQEELFNFADQALYAAKQQGRNRSVCRGSMR